MRANGKMLNVKASISRRVSPCKRETRRGLSGSELRRGAGEAASSPKYEANAKVGHPGTPPIIRDWTNGKEKPVPY